MQRHLLAFYKVDNVPLKNEQECFKPGKTHADSFLNSFKNICGRSTHLYNNPWVYYFFFGENRR